jgi:hypothetical protein
MFALGTGAAAVATVATLFPPPPSTWLPVAAIGIAIALLLRLVQWMVQPGRGDVAEAATPSQVLELVKTRRSVFPKDMTGKRNELSSAVVCSLK